MAPGGCPLCSAPDTASKMKNCSLGSGRASGRALTVATHCEGGAELVLVAGSTKVSLNGSKSSPPVIARVCVCVCVCMCVCV